MVTLIDTLAARQPLRHPEKQNRPDAPVLEALSWVPPFTPFIMAARAAADPPLWQIIGTGLLMAATTAVVIWIAGKAFRTGALSTGRVDFKGVIARMRMAE